MEQTKSNPIKISVRTLVEFILKSGDINSSSVGTPDKEAMQKGSKLHRKIQKRMGSNYQAEVYLSLEIPVTYQERSFELVVEGRADGVITETDGITIDEIKGSYMEVQYLEEPVEVHLAQAKCYAYLYATTHKQETMGVKMTYCNLETEIMKEFQLHYSYVELERWFYGVIEEYAKWAHWQLTWKEKRDASIKQVAFPFAYREGQKKLVTGVYQTILREKRLYIEAPTGVGKTISTIFPAVKAMGEGLVSKLFYLTAKTITRTVAEDTFSLLKQEGVKIKTVTLTAKDKICVCETVSCNPSDCERAQGHFDRVNDAVYDLLVHEEDMTREKLEEYATKHRVCPFEMALDATLWVDGIIGDYNYVFDPRVYLKRFFSSEKKQNYIFLVDEAHNLVDRAREMYSATIIKERFLSVKRLAKGRSSGMERRLEACNRSLLSMKRESEDVKIHHDIESFGFQLMQLSGECYEFLKQFQSFEGREEVLELYFEIGHFLNMYELCNEKYIIYSETKEQGEFALTLQCMDPSTNLNLCLERGKSAIFFSATLLPIDYYKEQLAGREEDYAIYADSIFDKKKRLLLVANDVSTKYNRRNQWEYDKVATYIKTVVEQRVGNYLVFFPSYQYMNAVEASYNKEENLHTLVSQSAHMKEEERESFLATFRKNPTSTSVGFCVMGGIFSEGIDLKGDRLIGTIIVGTGLPMVGTNRELFREYYAEKKGTGFEYAYLYPGMNKVLQSAGRVIRTEADEGIIVLLDERFLQHSYERLFPREWFPYTVVNRNTVANEVTHFWSKKQLEEEKNESSNF